MEKRIGQGTITAECRNDGTSVASELYANYPCRLHLTSRPNNEIVHGYNDTNTSTHDETNNSTESTPIPRLTNIPKSLTCYVLGYGGGLISGDTINLQITVKPRASLVITSQSTSKAFKAIPGRDPTVVTTNASVGKGGLLFLVPQPMQCFGGSRLVQETHVVLDGGVDVDVDVDSTNAGSSASANAIGADDPSLLLVDWYTGGRKNLDGGVWNMESFHTTTTISYSKDHLFPTPLQDIDEHEHEHEHDNKDSKTTTECLETDLVFRDATRLSGGKDLVRHMRRFNIVCMVVLIGPRVKKVSDLFLKKFSSRHIYEETTHYDDNDGHTNGGTKTSQSYHPKGSGRRGLNQNRGQGLNESNEGLLVSCGTFDTSSIPGSKQQQNRQQENGVVIRLAADTLEIAATFLSKHIGTLDGQLVDDPFLEILSSKQCIIGQQQTIEANNKDYEYSVDQIEDMPIGLMKNSFIPKGRNIDSQEEFQTTATKKTTINPLILYQLIDSCVPSGGFAHSNTLEAAHQLHLLQKQRFNNNNTTASWRVSLREHCFDVLLQTFTSTVPFLIEACHLFRSHYHNHDQTDEGGLSNKPLKKAPKKLLQKWQNLDIELRSTMNSHVACRASTLQGSGMLRAFSAAFPTITPVIQILRRRIIRMSPSVSSSSTTTTDHLNQQQSTIQSIDYSSSGHAATCFGSVCGLLDINDETCVSMFLYTTARDMVNAAVRMNLIGPLEGGCVTNELCVGINELIEAHLDDLIFNHCEKVEDGKDDGDQQKNSNTCSTHHGCVGIAHAHQVAPLIEVLSNAHDRLYSRLFNS